VLLHAAAPGDIKKGKTLCFTGNIVTLRDEIIPTMELTERFAIAWKELKNGTYGFDFKADKSLFETFESSEIKDGDLAVHLTLERSESQLSIQTAIRGTVTVACDRCLDDCLLPVRFDGKLLVRFSDDIHDYDGETMWLSPSENEVSLAQYIYESIVLSLPYRRVHPEGACDPDMLRRFRIVSEEQFSQIEREAEASQTLDGDTLERLTSLRKELDDKKE